MCLLHDASAVQRAVAPSALSAAEQQSPTHEALVANLEQHGRCLNDDLHHKLDPAEQLPPTPTTPGHFGGLEKIYYINVDGSVERQAFMERELSASGVPYERFPAVHVDEVSAGKYDDVLGRVGKGLNTNLQLKGNGSIACALSHRLLYEHILSEHLDSNGTVMVLEDDVAFNPGWQNTLHNILASVPAGASAVMSNQVGQPRCDDIVNEQLALSTRPWRRCSDHPYCKEDETLFYAGADSVLLFPSTLPTLLEEMSQHPLGEADQNLVSRGSARTYAMLNRFMHTSWIVLKGSDRRKGDR